ncbi:MAG: T9SS type A sorting domain-containing protein [Cytophagaceae bacterium]|nr:T9SS type A sorting domain-containing protein [Cytophagaceae bacterium]
MKPKFNLLVLIFFFISIHAIAQKPVLNIPVKAYVELTSANYFGGKLAIQDSITKQFQRMNQYYNAETRFTHTYNFYISSFQFYTDNGNNDSTNYYNGLVTGFLKIVYDNFVPFDMKGYNSYLHTIHYCHDGVNGKSGHMFGRIPNKGLFHEFGHSRSAIDIYAVNIDGSQNQVATGLGFRTPYNSIMNDLYVESGWDTHSIYLMNTTATTYGVGPFTGAQHDAIVKGAFPQNISIRVKDATGNAVPNATVKLYGVTWYMSNDFAQKLTTANAAVNTTTNTSGILNFTSTNNPFNTAFTGEAPTQYISFFVAVTANGQTRYDWLTIYDVQSSKAAGLTTHYLDVVIKTATLAAPNKKPLADLAVTGDGQYRTFPSNIWLVTGAFDLDNAITSVKMYDGSTLLGNANFEPDAFRYAYQLLNLPVGTHSIKAVVTDASGSVAETLPILMTIVPPAPSVSLTAPLDNSSFFYGTAITLNASAAAGSGTNTKVEFYNGNIKLGEDATSPYSYNWTNAPLGTTQISARAYNSAGFSAVANALKITVNPANTCTDPVWNSGTAYVNGDKVSYLEKKYQANWWTQNNPPNTNSGAGMAWTDLGNCGSSGNAAPTVSLTAPSNNQSYTAPATVNITANAADSDGSISKVEFYNGLSLIFSDNTSPYTYSWTSVAIGTYVLKAIAYDNLLNTTTSSVVTITVSAGGTCTAVQWNAGNASYINGTIIKNTVGGIVKRYQCTVAGWCQSASAYYYEPGNGTAWTSCWNDLGSCTSRSAADHNATETIAFEIYPNPANHRATITAALTGTLVTLYLINQMGTEILTKEINVGSTGLTDELDLSGLMPGIYTLKLSAGETVLYKRLLKN